MHVLFGAVNYGTSNLISQWAVSARKASPGALLVLVDNFSTEKELNAAKKLANDHGIILIESDNCGYGTSLNKIVSYCKARFPTETDSPKVLLLGNLDVSFNRVEFDDNRKHFACLASGVERGCQLNPFLTVLQKRFLFMHKIAIFFNSPLILLLSTVLIKALGIFKSPPWTMHGSLFCISYDSITGEKIFNDKSFLYSEELEFGSYLERNNIPLVWSGIEYQHIANVSTSKIIRGHREFFNYWWPSFNNWLSANSNSKFSGDSYLLYRLSPELLENKATTIDDLSLVQCNFNLKYSIIEIQRRIQQFLFFGNNSGKYHIYKIRVNNRNVGLIFLSPINLYRTAFLDNNSYELTVEIDEKFRNKGLAYLAVREVMSLHSNIYALIRYNNVSSNALFSKLGVTIGQLGKVAGFVGAKYYRWSI